MSQEKMTRRRYLKYAGAAVAAGAVAAAGYGAYQYYKPPAQTTTLPTTPPTTTTPTGGAKKKVRIGGTKPLTGQETLNGRTARRSSYGLRKLAPKNYGIPCRSGQKGSIYPKTTPPFPSP